MPVSARSLLQLCVDRVSWEFPTDRITVKTTPNLVSIDVAGFAYIAVLHRFPGGPFCGPGSAGVVHLAAVSGCRFSAHSASNYSSCSGKWYLFENLCWQPCQAECWQTIPAGTHKAYRLVDATGACMHASMTYICTPWLLKLTLSLICTVCAGVLCIVVMDISGADTTAIIQCQKGCHQAHRPPGMLHCSTSSFYQISKVLSGSPCFEPGVGCLPGQASADKRQHKASVQAH